MKRVLLLVALLSTDPADACSISIVEARILRPTAGDVAGQQPLIWVTDKPTKFTRVAASCAKQVVCKGAPVEVERVGRYVRPKAPLPAGSRLQITRAGVVLDEARIGEARALPAWGGIAWGSAKQAPAGKCTPAGPVIELRIKPTQVSLADAYLLVYAAKPDGAGLGSPIDVRPLEHYSSTLELRNAYGGSPYTAVPKLLYVRLADGDGHVGPVITLP